MLKIQNEKTANGDLNIDVLSDQGVRRSSELDAHFATLFILFHQYKKHELIAGRDSDGQMANVFRYCCEELKKEVDLLGAYMLEKGAVPVTDPELQARLAYIKHDNLGECEQKGMIRRDLKNEKKHQGKLKESIKVNRQLGNVETNRVLRYIGLKSKERLKAIQQSFFKRQSRNVKSPVVSVLSLVQD